MNKKDLIKKSILLYGDKYDYKYIPEIFKTSDTINLGYKNLIFKQKVSEHLKGKKPEETRVRDTNDFINKSKMLWGHNKYDYSLCEFKNIKSHVKIIFNKKVYSQIAQNHLSGLKCENKWDKEKFIIESKKIFKDKYDYRLVNYINFNTPVKILHNGIIYEQKPIHHLRGNCVEKSNRSKKLNKEIFISNSIELHGNRYDYSLVEYINTRTPVKILFENEIYFQEPQHHLVGLKPEGTNVKDTKSFILKSNQIHSNRYDYSLVEYINHHTYVKILHNGVLYLQKPYCHLRGDRPEDRNYKRTNVEFISMCNLVHDYKFIYTKTIYTGSNTKVIIECPIHGEFIQNANSHIRGIGCCNCNESKGEKVIAKYLDRNNISYYRQHKFEYCKNIFQLPFDFYIPKIRTAIEFDGKQHFEPNSHFGGLAAYEKLKVNDKIKDDYCEDNYIELVRITYDQVDSIEEILKNYIIK